MKKILILISLFFLTSCDNNTPVEPVDTMTEAIAIIGNKFYDGYRAVSDIDFLTQHEDVTISYSSDDNFALSNDGTINRPLEESTIVNLTVTFEKNGETEVRVYVITVYKQTPSISEGVTELNKLLSHNFKNGFYQYDYELEDLTYIWDYGFYEDYYKEEPLIGGRDYIVPQLGTTAVDTVVCVIIRDTINSVGAPDSDLDSFETRECLEIQLPATS